MADNMPAAEVVVDEPLVRRLLAAQFPAGAYLPLRLEANGWDNVVFRLGPDLAVRLPRRQAAAELVLNEQRWLPVLAPALPLPAPVPVLAGRPADGYPWPWSVVPWFAGGIAASTPPADPAAAADTLGQFVAALHRPAPLEAPANPVRGGPLAHRHDAVEERLTRVGPTLAPAERAALTATWADSLAAPAWSGAPRWLHGDLHPANLLVDEQGHLSAVIDFGDLTAGDPATDLAVAWMLFDDGPPRERFLAAAGGPTGYPDEATIARARGWAVNLALAMAASSADNPTMAAVARRTIANLTADS